MLGRALGASDHGTRVQAKPAGSGAYLICAVSYGHYLGVHSCGAPT